MIDHAILRSLQNYIDPGADSDEPVKGIVKRQLLRWYGAVEAQEAEIARLRKVVSDDGLEILRLRAIAIGAMRAP